MPEIKAIKSKPVAVPIRGLFNLTVIISIFSRCVCSKVSVPIRGLFNLTRKISSLYLYYIFNKVSVPIRGLFNLTILLINTYGKISIHRFPSPLGDYLI